MTVPTKRRFYKRPPPPEKIVTGNRPLRSGALWIDVAEDRGRAWIPFASAVSRMAVALGEDAALNGLLWRVRTGRTAISCRRLVYQNVFVPSETRAYAWPAQAAGIASQIDGAFKSWTIGHFNLDWKTGNGGWFDILAKPPTRVYLFDAQIDAATLPAGMVPALPTGPLIDGVALRTGGAGRPSTVDVGLRIMEDHARRGVLKPRLTQEVRALQTILQTHDAYAAVPKIKDKSLENGIRLAYLAARNGIK